MTECLGYYLFYHLNVLAISSTCHLSSPFGLYIAERIFLFLSCTVKRTHLILFDCRIWAYKGKGINQNHIKNRTQFFCPSICQLRVVFTQDHLYLYFWFFGGIKLKYTSFIWFSEYYLFKLYYYQIKYLVLLFLYIGFTDIPEWTPFIGCTVMQIIYAFYYLCHFLKLRKSNFLSSYVMSRTSCVYKIRFLQLNILIQWHCNGRAAHPSAKGMHISKFHFWIEQNNKYAIIFAIYNIVKRL